MKISVVIPAYNEEKLIGKALDAVQSAQEVFIRRRWDTEIIVCDNNSQDRTGKIARDAGAVVVWEEVNQIGRARNRGAAAAQGDWLIFIDADSQPEAALFELVAQQIEGGVCLAGGATIRMDGNVAYWNVLTEFWNWLSKRLSWMAGSFIFCEARAFRTVRGFSNEFYVGEELDLSRRLKRLARLQGKSIVILDRCPLLTSGRKARLYSAGEHGLFLFRALLLPWRTMRDRSACHPWYDGRR